mgnify:CR=1 FL=1
MNRLPNENKKKETEKEINLNKIYENSIVIN